MKNIYFAANSRGFADHGWLKSYHTFSFANYFNPDRMNFGALRVLNDDRVEAGRGFGTHSHQNMEIISIPLKGSLRHEDSEGNQQVIRAGEVQIMSAGTGIQHSEFNHSDSEEVNFLQIWIIPKNMNIHPRYEQKEFDFSNRRNEFIQVVQPIGQFGEGIGIYQDAYFYLGHFDSSTACSYSIQFLNSGLYLFVLEGECQLGNQSLKSRDALGVTETSKISIDILRPSQLLLMEVPL